MQALERFSSQLSGNFWIAYSEALFTKESAAAKVLQLRNQKVYFSLGSPTLPQIEPMSNLDHSDTPGTRPANTASATARPASAASAYAREQCSSHRRTPSRDPELYAVKAPTYAGSPWRK